MSIDSYRLGVSRGIERTSAACHGNEGQCWASGRLEMEFGRARLQRKAAPASSKSDCVKNYSRTSVAASRRRIKNLDGALEERSGAATNFIMNER